jgi:hypothetical protein
MTKYSVKVAECISEWGQKAAACNGSIQCLDDCAKELRKSLDSIFPYSKNIEFESDKVNYILSSIFFLASRLAKASIGLAEFDTSVTKIGQMDKDNLEEDEKRKFQNELDGILSKYF